MPIDGREQEHPQHAGDRGRHRIGPDQQRLVGERAAHHAVGHRREQQRDRRCRAPATSDAEHRRDLERVEVVRCRGTGRRSCRARRTRSSGRTASCSRNEYQTACAAGQKKKTSVIAICGASSAYGSHAERKTTRFSIADGGAWRDGAGVARTRRPAQRSRAPLAPSSATCWRPRTCAGSRCRASPRRRAPSWRPSCRRTPLSSSSSMTSRPCTKLPKRRPFEFAVGGLLVSCLTATSAPGFLS